MAELIFSSGFDAWVDQAHPDGNRSGGDAVRLQTAQRKGVVQIPVTGIRGKTVTSAILYGHVLPGWSAQTLTAKMLAAGINPSKVTWNNLPAAVAGVTAGTVTTGALANGASVAIPVTEIMQAAAAGTKYHGFLITTDETTPGDANLRSFTSGKRAWQLVVEISDAPDKPTKLRPNDGAVSHGAPTVAWDSGETDHTALQVQVDPGADAGSPDYDSGTVTSDDSAFDLSSDGDFTALSSGDSTQWRVRVQNADGAWSPWSDWASFTYTPKPTLTLDSPVGAVIGDPTPNITAHLTGETLRKYRIRVTAGTDRTDVLYDSGEQPPDAGTVALEVPWRSPEDHRRIIKHDDTSYQINVRAWGSVVRAEAVNDPAYVQTWVTVTFEEGATEAPADYTVEPVEPGDPRMVHTWTRSEDVDAWLIMSGGEVVHRLTADDVTADAGTYQFTDQGETKPYLLTSYKVRGVEDGTRTPSSDTVTVLSEVTGFWLIPDDGDEPIMCTGGNPEAFVKNEKFDSFQPLNIDTDVDLVYGYEGISGAFSEGTIDNRNPTAGPTAADVLGAIDRLERIRTNAGARPRLIWGTQSIRAQIKNMTPLPSAGFLRTNLEHHVSFAFKQDGD